MTVPTCKHASRLRGQDFRDLRHRIKENRDDDYPAEHFAADLGISPSLLQFIETDQRSITPPVAAAYRRVARSFAFWMKDVEQVNAQTGTWLVDALIRHYPWLSKRDRNRLKKLVRE